MNREHLTSEQVWLLLAIWETRSITRAAQTIHISKATATRLLTAARTLLRDRLFLRGGDGLVPTARMVQLAPQLQTLQQGLVNIVRQPPTFEPASLNGTIRIAGVDNAAIAFLLPCFKTLYTSAPGLRLSYVPLSEHFCQHLENGLIDLAFYAPPLKLEPDFHEMTLYASDHITVVRNQHPILQTLDERQKAGLKLVPEDFEPYREILLTYGSLEGDTAPQRQSSPDDQHVAMDCAHFLASAYFLLESDFYVQLPYVTAQWLAKHLPITLLPHTVGAPSRIWKARLIWHERTDRDPAMQWFRSVFASSLRGKDQQDVAMMLLD